MSSSRPNILLIMVDQLRYPQAGRGGFDPDIEQILSFMGQGTLDDNTYAKHFPGFLKLREYAKVLVDHTIAESACIPSRAAIMTGQYGLRTGVTQTDGLFKSGDALNFPWLKADGTPTIGDWFQALGYTTHYFGKWHVSDPPEHTLLGFGFADWELSWPEPHGSLLNNLGTFRDYQFADLACTFLRNRGLGVPYARASSTVAGDDPGGSTPDTAPFFAVCSFTNPHDIATYAFLPRLLTDPLSVGPHKSVPIPPQGSKSRAPKQGSFNIPLNETGLPQACAKAPLSIAENLRENKPSAQYDYSIKLGLGLSAKTALAFAQKAGNSEADPGTVIEQAVKLTLEAGTPFQLQDEPEQAGVAFLQYYAYMIMMVDRHILRVLETLEAAGLRENTLVVFLADHGELGASHSLMMEKWHGAYQETVSVPVLFSNPSLNPATDAPVAVNAQTSHIDILPTLLSFAGAQASDIEQIRRTLSMTHQAAPLPGANLKSVIEAGGGPVYGPHGHERTGVLFVTDDMITEPLPVDDDPHNTASLQQYEVYRKAVDVLRTPPSEDAPHPYFPDLQPGPVVQPCHVRALRTGPWKLVRYCDPWSAKPVPDQWEFYNLDADPCELFNLLVYDAAFPTVASKLPPKLDVTPEQIADYATKFAQELARQEAALLSPYPSAHPTAGATIGR
jgi:arylsulfatase A-like enzyme